MFRNTKRTLSLLLALIMLCSAMSVMAMAQERADTISCACGICSPRCQWNEFLHYDFEKHLEYVTECSTHLTHDMKVYANYERLKCTRCQHITYVLRSYEYECLKD